MNGQNGCRRGHNAVSEALQPGGGGLMRGPPQCKLLDSEFLSVTSIHSMSYLVTQAMQP